MLENIYTELIAEHSQSQENRRILSNATIKERGHNPSCGDEITLELEITDDGELEELDEATALKNISTMPARVKCATLAWHTLDNALKNSDGGNHA